MLSPEETVEVITAGIRNRARELNWAAGSDITGQVQEIISESFNRLADDIEKEFRKKESGEDN